MFILTLYLWPSKKYRLWHSKRQIQELHQRRKEVQMGGGEKAIEKQEAMAR